MNISLKDSSLWLGLIAGALLVQLLKDKPLILAPAGDTKISSAYMRNGFANILMATERRQQYSQCYENFVKDRESHAAQNLKNLTTRGTPNTPPTPQLELPARERVEGSLTYIFQVRENGELVDYELANDEFKDLKFSKCIQTAFKDLRFLPPPLGINRFIAYEMSFKKDETIKKELEEKKASSPLTLVPTPGGTDSSEEKSSH